MVQGNLFNEPEELEVHGETYDRERDLARLTGLMKRVYILMADGRWRSTDEIRAQAGGSSADRRLRDLALPKYGGHKVDVKHVSGGCWHYRLTPYWKVKNETMV